MKHTINSTRWLRIFALSLVAGTILYACQTWGEWDNPAGNQRNPDTSIKLLTSFPFKIDLSAENTDLSGEAIAFDGGVEPSIFKEEARGEVLHISDGYLRIANPLKDVTADVGASFTFWMNSADLTRPVFSYSDDEAGEFAFNGNTELNFRGTGGNLKVNDAATVTQDIIHADQWHYVGVILTKTGFAVYVDGEKKQDKSTALSISDPEFDFSAITELTKKADYLQFGYNTSGKNGDLYISRLKVYKNAVSINELQPDEEVTQVTPPVYFNDFEGDHDARIIGNGVFTDDAAAFGTIFKNATGGMRENYLLLPENVLSHSTVTKELSVGVWVNAKEAGPSGVYGWSPLFMAYGNPPGNDGNTWPMFALQYRGIAQVNCAGWCDFTNEQNVKGVNTLYHFATDWLADGQWHYYTATFTETTAKIYFDGELKNEWFVPGTDGQTIAGLFSHGSDLKYVCLGGNQAWNWGDPDPGFMFDDIAIYNVELTAAEIAFIMSQKK